VKAWCLVALGLCGCGGTNYMPETPQQLASDVCEAVVKLPPPPGNTPEAAIFQMLADACAIRAATLAEAVDAGSK